MSQTEVWRVRKRIQRAVILTPDSRCQLCNRRKGKAEFHRHHLYPVHKSSVAQASDTARIIVICKACHIGIHRPGQ